MKEINNCKFVYVFDPAIMNRLSSAGFELLKADNTSQIYVFANRGNIHDYLYDCSCLYSNTLTF